jgi:hypothetical protein
VKGLVLAVCLALGGCAEWGTETKVEEGAFQVVSAVDTVQSLAIARNPDRLQESAWPTAAVLTTHPSRLNTVLWGAGRGAAHAFITDRLEAVDANDAVKRLWQGVTIGFEYQTVQNNRSIGIGYTGSFK